MGCGVRIGLYGGLLCQRRRVMERLCRDWKIKGFSPLGGWVGYCSLVVAINSESDIIIDVLPQEFSYYGKDRESHKDALSLDLVICLDYLSVEELNLDSQEELEILHAGSYQQAYNAVGFYLGRITGGVYVE